MPEQKKESIKETQLVIFRLAKEDFGLDISQVREIIRMQDITPMPHAPKFIEGVINLRGQIIAVMDLAKRFSLDAQKRSDKTRIVVTETHGTTVGFVVDEVPEVLRMSLDSIEKTPDLMESQIHTDFIKGVGKVKDKLIILLDVDRVLSKEEAKQVAAGAEK